MRFLLKGLKWVNGQADCQGDIRIANGVLGEIGQELTAHKGEQMIRFDNHYMYPGLINSHDHLEMNLYPRMGRPPYGNYTEWGKDIYRPKESPIKEIERVDLKDRLLWGGLRNLISGVTTVVHHNPWHRSLSSDKFPVQVLKNIAWSHSLAFGKNIESNFPKNSHIPYVIHAAEGIDKLAAGEIGGLHEKGLLQNNTVLVHAMALSPSDMDRIFAAGCAVVWCPASNFYLFNKTADVQKLKGHVPLGLGSDSTLTGSTIFLDEMRCAHQSQMANWNEIFEMVTDLPAKIFHLPTPSISTGAPADLMIAPAFHPDYCENLQHLTASNITAVFVHGVPNYADGSIEDSLPLAYSIRINGILKKVNIDIRQLMARIEKQVGTATLQSNALWKMIQLQ